DANDPHPLLAEMPRLRWRVGSLTVVWNVGQTISSSILDFAMSGFDWFACQAIRVYENRGTSGCSLRRRRRQVCGKMIRSRLVLLPLIFVLSGQLPAQDARDVAAGGLSITEQCEALEQRVFGQWEALLKLLNDWISKEQPDLPAEWESLFGGLESLQRQADPETSTPGGDLSKEINALRKQIAGVNTRLVSLPEDNRKVAGEKIKRIEGRLETVEKELEELSKVCGRVRKNLEELRTAFDINTQLEGVVQSRETLSQQVQTMMAGIEVTGGGMAGTGTGKRPVLVATPLNAPGTNSLGMKFVPVPGTQVLMSVWETRVRDYRAFRPETNGEPDHPVVEVSWEDARAFAEWLSRKEGKRYRLPTDHEWSLAVGIGDRENATASPEEKDGKIEGVYPWGTQWPPPQGAGNYDASLACDRFDGTAPVGSFAPNQLGLYDLGGNVWEWCEDLYSSSVTYRVLRGGSWFDHGSANLLSSNRLRGTPSGRFDFSGFRVVLEVGSGG
ncbi:MAG: SUMF1/EgtB/PvdO family nonheme iron enzyme, partial [Verrucomicrobia bacterium]|nr:SUMF1/EgtB/PvdO family nonheme iron enzyme [Verrucomicrobiota bacterium]